VREGGRVSGGTKAAAQEGGSRAAQPAKCGIGQHRAALCGGARGLHVQDIELLGNAITLRAALIGAAIATAICSPGRAP